MEKVQPCDEYFRDSLVDVFAGLQLLAIIGSSIQLVFMIATFALICRLKEFYRSENISFGDYRHVPFGKVRNLDDLLGST